MERKRHCLAAVPFYFLKTIIIFSRFKFLRSMVKQERNNSFLRALARRLRQLREERGLSQERVLFLTGIYVILIEAGRRNISVSTLIALCETYRIKPSDLLENLHDDGQADS